MKAHAKGFALYVVGFFFDTFGPTRRTVERWAAERAASSKRTGFLVGLAVYVTSSMLGSSLYTVIAFLGVFALAQWGEPRPGAIARWAATTIACCAVLVWTVAIIMLAIAAVILGIGALIA